MYAAYQFHVLSGQDAEQADKHWQWGTHLWRPVGVVSKGVPLNKGLSCMPLPGIVQFAYMHVNAAQLRLQDGCKHFLRLPSEITSVRYPLIRSPKRFKEAPEHWVAAPNRGAQRPQGTYCKRGFCMTNHDHIKMTRWTRYTR